MSGDPNPCSGGESSSADWLANMKSHHELKEEYEKYRRNEVAPLNSLKRTQEILSQSITQSAILGPLINELYSALLILKILGPCEVLLYLSGHGLDPGNICLVPGTMRPHPTRSEHDLREIDPDKWYESKYDEVKEAERYLEAFYCKYAEAFGDYSGPLGFVGGEVYAHHRGFIGVLGVLGLWCHAHHKECKADTYHHLVIVADCCFAGIWGATLDHIMKCTEPCLEGYHKLLLKYPVSIQCATNEFEASRGGLFTPLWYFLQTATEQQLRNYRAAFNESEHVSDDEMETQHPCYVSTSQWRPTLKCFDDPAFFLHLQREQLKALKLNLGNEENLEAWRVACEPTPKPDATTNCNIKKEFKQLKHFSPIVQPLMTPFVGMAFNLRRLLYETERRLSHYERYQDAYRKEIERDKQAKDNIKASLAALKGVLCETVDWYSALMPRSRNLPCNYFLSGDNLIDELIGAYGEELRRQVKKKPRDRRYDVAPGVYVFQGGKGDMSLIVTPGYEQVILIDGTCNTECFIAAWNSILRYLPRITMIFVTHHDEDHTYGIQLLLARYCVGQTGIPDISSTTIYMNTRAALRLRSFGHEKEIESLVEMLRARNLILAIEPVIIDGLPERLVNDKHLFVLPLLPTRELVETCYSKVPEEGSRKKYTGTVYSRGDTTAANVLSINVVAVWKNRDAYLFTGDAHLKDVTQAAQDFLHIHRMESFKYVDVPHHGSANSNVKKVNPEDRGLARIPAEHYLISHCGNHHNPSFQTVKDILKREDREITLHFLYERRKYEPKKDHRTCSDKKCKGTSKTAKQNWYCTCVSKDEQAKIRYPREHKYEYFGFAD